MVSILVAAVLACPTRLGNDGPMGLYVSAKHWFFVSAKGEPETRYGEYTIRMAGSLKQNPDGNYTAVWGQTDAPGAPGKLKFGRGSLLGDRVFGQGAPSKSFLATGDVTISGSGDTINVRFGNKARSETFQEDMTRVAGAQNDFLSGDWAATSVKLHLEVPSERPPAAFGGGGGNHIDPFRPAPSITGTLDYYGKQYAVDGSVAGTVAELHLSTMDRSKDMGSVIVCWAPTDRAVKSMTENMAVVNDRLYMLTEDASHNSFRATYLTPGAK